MHHDLDQVASNLGVATEDLSDVAVLVLPENAATGNWPSEVYDTDDAVMLAKFLKGRGVRCKTAFDLGASCQLKDRRGDEIWLGLIYLFAENVAFPLAVEAVKEWIVTSSRRTTTTVHLELRMRRKRTSAELRFDGDADDLVRILAALKGLPESKDGS